MPPLQGRAMPAVPGWALDSICWDAACGMPQANASLPIPVLGQGQQAALPHGEVNAEREESCAQRREALQTMGQSEDTLAPTWRSTAEQVNCGAGSWR